MKNYFNNRFPVNLRSVVAIVPFLTILLIGSAFSCRHDHVDKENAATEITPVVLPTLNIKVQLVADGLQAPLATAFPGNGEMLVVEQTGIIKVYKNGKANAVPFLDIRNKIVKLSGDYDERGLLGLALSPNFKTNHKFYVYYSAPPIGSFDNTGTLAEFKTTANGDVADPKSERIFLTVQHPESNHNGGCLQFGPDGYLYISEGDGGGAGDKHNGTIGNGQNMNTFLGKLLRIDVNSGSTYTVPKDNPFVGNPNVKPEIYAYGLRNTWRYSFDKATGELFAGDVGQDTYEEVDIIKKGGNYGWHITEATHCFSPATGCSFTGITMPIAEYSHHEGASITGGYVYNGKVLTGFTGKYIFGDWTGPMFYLQKSGTAWKRGKIAVTGTHPDNLKITSFGEDPDGELYVVTNQNTGPGGVKGAVYKIVK
jgi:glucose/arabinose dehydrogenase